MFDLKEHAYHFLKRVASHVWFNYLYLLYSDLNQDLLNHSYTITMECEKSVALQATADTEYLIADSFLIDGHLTDLYLFTNELKLIQKNKVRVIPIHFGLSFIVL